MARQPNWQKRDKVTGMRTLKGYLRDPDSTGYHRLDTSQRNMHSMHSDHTRVAVILAVLLGVVVCVTLTVRGVHKYNEAVWAADACALREAAPGTLRYKKVFERCWREQHEGR